MNKLAENRWVPHRVGLVNYWYYDEEEFHFSNGKLLLRGGNGSGKSVTMQSFIPLLLDGNKSPERLDPFGSRARQMQDYLLGDEDRQIEQRTGYLFMEFKRANSEQFLTIGIGLQARRYKGVDSWGFAITDGRRIGYDLELYTKGALLDDERAKIPISKRDLKELLGEGGELCQSQGEYMALVNQLVFGFNSLEEYDELIKLLIHLRSPKLSKDFKPSVLYEIMNSSLQALSDEDLRPLTETIENMDQMRTQLEQLKLNRKAALKIRGEYDKYNRAVLYNKASSWQRTNDEYNRLQKAISHNEKILDEERLEVECLGTRIVELEQERDALQVKERELRSDDAFQLEEKYQNESKKGEQLRDEISEKEAGLSLKIAREAEMKGQTTDLELEGANLEKQVSQTLSDLGDLAEEARFEDHVFNQGDLEKFKGQPFDFAPWQGDVARYLNGIKAARSVLEDEQRETRRYNELLQEHDRYVKERDSVIRAQEEAESFLELKRQEYLISLADWYEGNEKFKLDPEKRHPLNQIILDYGDNKAKGDLEQYLFPLYQDLDQKLMGEILNHEQKRKNLEERVSEEQAELKKWVEMVDPVPLRDAQVLETRRVLEKAGIPHLPFYEAVDFREDLTDVQKGDLEAVFADLGILDALIVPADMRGKTHELLGQGTDKILFPSPKEEQVRPNLHLSLKVVCPPGVLSLATNEILASFSVRQYDADYFIGKNGEYSFGRVKGKARRGQSARFIGAESRRKYKEDQIAMYEAEISSLNEECIKIMREIERVSSDRERLKWEFSNFPSTIELDKAVDICDKTERELVLKTEKLEGQVTLMQDQFGVLQNLKNEVREKTRHFTLPLNLTGYKEAEQIMGRYEVVLARFDGHYHQWLAVEQRITSLIRILGELQEDVDYLKGELNVLNRNLQANRRLLAELGHLRETYEFKQIQEEIEIVVNRMKAIPEEIKLKATRKGHLEGRQISLFERLEKERQDFSIAMEKLSKNEKALQSELALGFVLSSTEGETEELVQEVLVLLKKEGDAEHDESTLTRRLQEAVYEQRTDLLEFGLTIKELDPEKDELRNRLGVTARLESKMVSLYQLVDWIENEITNNELLLDEADRELFEEIIMQTVGQKIRAKIYRAEEWVRNMNKLMAARDSTSGLTLHLQWRPKTAETEDELGTRELVNILKTDVSILSEDVFNQVTTHFRSQVDRAKVRLEEQDFRQSFHQTIQSVLDYRKWFEFKLFFQKTGENRKELTNRAFDRLSGGEKAMSMYIPLFSSVYSRYDAARADCPRLISLDEAFAGVDDSNIRDMFQLMEQLDFHYIINSQILWGDYDTVSGLSICELVRPKNADYVSVIRYHWDGKHRSLLLDKVLPTGGSMGETG
mgnify:CR=1 FL=1